MEALGVYSNSGVLFSVVGTKIKSRNGDSGSFSSPLIRSMASPKPGSPVRPVGTKKGSMVFPVGEPYSDAQESNNNSSPVKLLTRVEKLRLLSKAERAGLLSTAENLGLSLSSVEKLGLLSKAEDLGVLSAATDPGTPGTLLTVSLVLLVVGPFCAFVVPEDYAWEVVLQVAVALVSVVGGSAAFGASSFVSNLQKS